MLCCEIRKSRPLARRIAGLPAFFAGLRRAQAQSRASIEIFDRSGPSVKVNRQAGLDHGRRDPQYMHEHATARASALRRQGYTSIGCDPCTRAVVAGEDERAGRWWWESPEAVKECGLHFSADGRAERTVDVLLREVLAAPVPVPTLVRYERTRASQSGSRDFREQARRPSPFACSNA